MTFEQISNHGLKLGVFVELKTGESTKKRKERLGRTVTGSVFSITDRTFTVEDSFGKLETFLLVDLYLKEPERLTLSFIKENKPL